MFSPIAPSVRSISAGRKLEACLCSAGFWVCSALCLSAWLRSVASLTSQSQLIRILCLTPAAQTHTLRELLRLWEGKLVIKCGLPFILFIGSQTYPISASRIIALMGNESIAWADNEWHCEANPGPAVFTYILFLLNQTEILSASLNRRSYSVPICWNVTDIGFIVRLYAVSETITMVCHQKYVLSLRQAKLIC